MKNIILVLLATLLLIGSTSVFIVDEQEQASTHSAIPRENKVGHFGHIFHPRVRTFSLRARFDDRWPWGDYVVGLGGKTAPLLGWRQRLVQDILQLLGPDGLLALDGQRVGRIVRLQTCGGPAGSEAAWE